MGPTGASPYPGEGCVAVTVYFRQKGSTHARLGDLPTVPANAVCEQYLTLRSLNCERLVLIPQWIISGNDHPTVQAATGHHSVQFRLQRDSVTRSTSPLMDFPPKISFRANFRRFVARIATDDACPFGRANSC